MADNSKTITSAAASELWWMTTTQGVAAIFFGLAAIFWPSLTLVILVYLFSAFLLVMGVVEMINGLVSIRHRNTWWLTVLVGLIGLGVGVYLIRHPEVSIQAFIIIVGLALIARGLVDMIMAFVNKDASSHRTLSIVIGAIAVLAGIVIMLQPAAGGVAFVWILGLYALVYGVLIVALAFDMRSTLQNTPSNE